MNTERVSEAKGLVEGAEERVTGLALPTWVWVFMAIGGGTVFHIWIHYREHGVFNAHQIALAFFLVINVLINFWELALFFARHKVRAEYAATKEPFKGREVERSAQLFGRRIPLHRVWRFSEWSGIWSTYALFDPGYAKKSSFGFIIDVGNGVSTVVPATIFALGMTFHFWSAQVLGIIGVVCFWQMFYGTVLYFFQFFYAQRHKGHTVKNILLFVGGSNGLWFVFPLWGMGVCVWMILNNSFAIFS